MVQFMHMLAPIRDRCDNNEVGAPLFPYKLEGYPRGVAHGECGHCPRGCLHCLFPQNPFAPRASLMLVSCSM